MGPGPTPNSFLGRWSEDATDSREGEEGRLWAPGGPRLAYELKVAQPSWMLVRGISAWPMAKFPIREALCGVWLGEARGVENTSLQSGFSSPVTGLADRDPRICPARRGAHAAREQGGHPRLSSPPGSTGR